MVKDVKQKEKLNIYWSENHYEDQDVGGWTILK
jgi:hypothetical protein